MSNKEDNVMDLLDSLDVKQGGQKQKPKKSSTKRKENSKKATGDDILGFLDELEVKKKTDSEEKAKKEQSSEAPSNESSESSAVQNKEAAPEAPKTETTENQMINPMSTISGWWNRNKGDLWSKAQEKIQSAAQDAVNQARQAEAMMDTSAFSLNAIQTRLTTVLNTIVPPISQYEQLKIYVYHDMVGYPSVDDLLYQVFDYVMDQVEGGGEPQIVSEKGEKRVAAEKNSNKDGRLLNSMQGTLQEAAKAAIANIEALKERNKSKPEGEADENGEESSEPTKKSHVSEVYIAIQPVIAKIPTLVESGEVEKFHFVVVLEDPENNIKLSTASQSLPVEWTNWLDNNGHGFKEAAIDPREWVFGWVEDALNLAFGVIAQKYVTTRMGLTHDAKA